MKRGQDPLGIKIKLVHEEVVRVLSLHVELFQSPSGEILHIGGDDQIGSSLYGCRENVTIILVRKFDPTQDVSPTIYTCVTDRFIHDIHSTLSRPGAPHIQMNVFESTHRLFQNARAPQRSEQVGLRQVQQRVGQGDGNQNTRVKNRAESCHYRLSSWTDRRARFSASR